MWKINIHSFEKKKKIVIKCSCCQRTTSKQVISRRWVDENGCEKYRKGKMHVQSQQSVQNQFSHPCVCKFVTFLSPSCFSKDPKFFRPISGETIPFISSQRRGSKPSNFAIRLVFLTRKAIFFLSCWFWMGQLFNGSKKEMLSEARFSVVIFLRL